MIINERILKRLMKQAFKTGLAVARKSGKIYLAGPYWEMDIKENFLTKGIHAQIIELAGELPEEGERFSTTKEGNQMEMDYRMEVDETPFKKREACDITDFCVISESGVMQRVLQDYEGRKMLVNNVFVDIIDNSAAADKEFKVETPWISENGILWKNNVLSFCAMKRSDEKHKMVLEDLRSIDLLTEEADNE